MIEDLTFVEIIVYAFILVYSVAVVILTFKLLALCDKFDELIKIVRRQAGVREIDGKLMPIDNDGMVIKENERK
jgi:hypothetical protein